MTLGLVIENLMEQCFNLSIEELSSFNKILIYLPIRLGCSGVKGPS